jgi:hypothetical protein
MVKELNKIWKKQAKRRYCHIETLATSKTLTIYVEPKFNENGQN